MIAVNILTFCRYLIEIAKIYNIQYEPDPQVMREEGRPIGMFSVENCNKMKSGALNDLREKTM